VPVVVGVSGPGLDNMVRLTGEVMGAGAAGVMVAPMPSLNTDMKQKGYFAQVCNALGPDVPICLQDYPQTTGVNFSVETLLDIFAAHGQIVMLKHEDWPGLAKLSRIREATGQGAGRLSILTGNSALFLPQEMQRGADGAMTGFAYPEMMVQVVARHLAGDVDGAEDLFDAYLPMVRYEQQLGLGLAIRKEVLHRRGVLSSPKVRAPGPALSDLDKAELTRLTTRLEAKLAAFS
jgi:4-hydroxy-tetrahydrodipicolinate synthase